MRAFITVIEKWVGVPLAYLRFIASVSPRLFFRFLKIFSFGDCRKAAPETVVHTATLVATLSEDCGECVQIGINLAKKDGVPLPVIRAIVDRRKEILPEPLKCVYEFAEASLSPEGPDEKLRREIQGKYGEAALIEIAMAMAAARVFPQVKRALGYSVSCSLNRPSID